MMYNLFLIHLWTEFASCIVYPIVPSPYFDCPVESCLTLSSFAVNASLYLDNNTSLIFQPGNHTIHSKFDISDIISFSMISNQSRMGITCKKDSKPGFIFSAVNHVYIRNLKFFGCYCDRRDCFFVNKIIALTASSLVLVRCTFEDNVGTGLIIAANSNITIAQSTFRDNVRINSLNFIYCNVTIISSTFINNDGMLLSVSNFVHNSEIRSIIPLASASTMISGCEFRNSQQNIESYSMIYIDSDVKNLLSIYDTKFIGNRADTILDAMKSVINIDNNTFKHNHGLAMDFNRCIVDIHISVFNNNEEGVLRLWKTIIRIHGSEFKENVNLETDIYFARGRGGAIYSSRDSLISFNEVCTLAYNHAEQGGAIYLYRSSQCFIAHGATLIIANNTASADGGGIYLGDHSNLTLHSQSTLQIVRNRVTENGGGIYVARLSSINLGFKSPTNIGQTSNSTIYFSENFARKGGGLYLELNSTVYAFPCLNNIINFDKNSADYGGAVYALTAAESTSQYYPECLFQSEIPQNPAQNYSVSNGTIKCNKQGKLFYFSSNRANYSGFSLYKDAFSNCLIGERSFEEFELLSTISNIQASDVGSHRVQICYCENGLPDCSRQIPCINIKTGEKLILDVVIADRGNHIASGSIESEIRGSAQIRDDQKIQDVKNRCTALVFNIYSFEVSQQLIISPRLENNSIYSTTADSEKSIKLNFLACINCPIGFQQIKDDAKGCDCVCDVMRLGSYTVNCNYTSETITKKGTTAWIGYLSIKNTSDYLIYPYCPKDYCFAPDATIEINFNIPNGADAQCAHNRSGLLCGACSPGLSLSLGSSCCLQCHIHWPGVLVANIFSIILAGMVVVASLLILNLTVAVGTLTGLIFYANIVAANHNKFFPSTSFVTVFVSLLNLELGIDTCFFDGMDFYWKTWIQLAFPAYILLLVVLVIIVSEHSVKFAEIVAKRNPLATLNTLILLSYVKFLRTIILAFSFAILDYPDGSHPVVWWPDATVGYFSGKHIVLCIVAAIIFVAGIFYTAILFSWQWLLLYQHKMIFKWIQNQRLCMFVEPNHAPYAFKHRYWAGLLLLVRVIVYIISTADVSSDRTITLLAIGIILFFLSIFACSFQPYKSFQIQILEVTCYANIVCLCFATFYVSKIGKNQDTIAYISGTISLTLFLAVLMYHVTQLIFTTRCAKKLKNKLAQQFSNIDTEDQVNLVIQDNNKDEPVTYSEVDPPTRGEEIRPLSLSELRNKKTTSTDFEDNELRPIEHMIDSPTPYMLMN